MKKTILFFFLGLSALYGAEILDLVRSLDRNDTAGFERSVQTALDANAMRDDNNKTILMYASWVGNEEAVRYLIDKGADVNAVDSGGATALHLAIWKGFDSIALYLLDHGAQPDIMSVDGMTAVDIAAMKGNKTILEAIDQKKPKRKSLF